MGENNNNLVLKIEGISFYRDICIFFYFILFIIEKEYYMF